MVNEDAAILDRRVTQVTPAAFFNRRLHLPLLKLVNGLTHARYASVGSKRGRG